MNERSLLFVTYMTDTPKTRGEQTRAAILQAAHDLFIRQGYHGTSMRQVAQEAHIALGGLYNHFSSKDQVFEAVFLEFHPYHEMLPRVKAAQGKDVDELINHAIRLMVQAIQAHPEFMNLMFIELVEFKSAHTQKLFDQIYPQGMEILGHLLASYPNQIRPIPAPMLIRTLIGLFFGYYLTEVLLTPVSPPVLRENALQYFIDIYLHGIATTAQTPAPSQILPL